ncbi:MAG: Gfo/Idh/MocA family oxidoreductase [Candidatus Omnitrophica bacterium]|nr:Gfo/Idh/MocA family oxidoreductase [Candidatus Omnitrophota bacterium]
MKAAIVGAGHVSGGIARAYAMSHIESYRALRDKLSLVAIADISAQRRDLARKRLPDIRVYRDIDNLLEHEEIDILSICAPDETHEELVLKAMESNVRGIWCEKPMCLSVEGANKIIAKNRNKKIPIQVNYFRRFVPEIQKIHAIISSGKYGKIKLINGFYADTLIHNGTHLFDLILYLAGRLEVISAFRLEKLDRHKDGSVFVAGKIGDSASCIIQPFKRKYFNIFELDIFLERARIRIIEGARRIEIYRIVQDKAVPGLRMTERSPLIMECDWKGAFNLALSDLLGAVQGRHKDTLSSPENSLLLAMLFHKIGAILSKGS